MTSIAPGYEPIREIGKGAMGSVFLARATDGKEVAVKVLVALTPERRERFAREMRLLSQFGRSEGFVPLIDSGVGARGPFFVMPFLEGGTLRDRLRGGPLAVEEAVALGRAPAAALARAHARGIVHRDLKPENVLFGAAGEPLVADLGLAKHFSADAPGAGASVQLSKTGEIRGTVGYMAPEQMRDASHVSPPADVFALGAILHECLTGVAPFEGGTPFETISKIGSSDAPPPSAVRPGVPRWLDAVVLRALARDPRSRFEDAAALEQALARRAAPSRRGLLLPLGVAAVAAAVLVFRGRGASASAPPVAAARETPPATPALPDWFRDRPPSMRPSAAVLESLEPLAERDEYRNRRDGSVLVFVPAGAFPMGDDDAGEDEQPRHTVELSAYLVGKYETTVAKWRAYAAGVGPTLAEREGGRVAQPREDRSLGWVHRPKASWLAPDGDGIRARDDVPVVQITPDEAAAYARWAGLRLPTEAEWERAAGWTGAERRPFPWGDQDDYARRNAAGTPGGGALESVTARPDGASPVGAFGMAGNAAEWVIDTKRDTLYRERVPGERDPCHVAAGDPFVSRGGCFLDIVYPLRTFNRRMVLREDSANSVTGFRVALSADGSPRPR